MLSVLLRSMDSDFPLWYLQTLLISGDMLPQIPNPIQNNYITTHIQINKQNDHGYVPFVVTIIQSYYQSWFLTEETRGLLLAECEVLTLRDYMSLPPICLWGSCCSIFIFLCGVLYIMVFLFSFGHCVVYHSLSYGICLPFSIISLFSDYTRVA